MLTQREWIIGPIRVNHTNIIHSGCRSTTSNLLADGRVACENICVFSNCKLRGVGVADFEHTAPLCEHGSILFVLSTTLRQAVQT